MGTPCRMQKKPVRSTQTCIPFHCDRTHERFQINRKLDHHISLFASHFRPHCSHEARNIARFPRLLPSLLLLSWLTIEATLTGIWAIDRPSINCPEDHQPSRRPRRFHQRFPSNLCRILLRFARTKHVSLTWQNLFNSDCGYDDRVVSRKKYPSASDKLSNMRTPILTIARIFLTA